MTIIQFFIDTNKYKVTNIQYNIQLRLGSFLSDGLENKYQT